MKWLVFSSARESQHSIKLDASRAGDVFTRRDRAVRVRFKTFGLLRGKS
jgi:hypothetical protein